MNHSATIRKGSAISWLIDIAIVSAALTLTFGGFLFQQHHGMQANFGDGLGDSSSRMMHRIYNQAGFVSTLLGISAFAFWILKKVWLDSKKKKSNTATAIAPVMQFFQQRHVLFGWMFFALGLMHGTFYLISPHRGNWTATGLLAWAGMFSVVGLGLMLQKKMINLKYARYWHWIASLFFAVGLIIHIAFS